MCVWTENSTAHSGLCSVQFLPAFAAKIALLEPSLTLYLDIVKMNLVHIHAYACVFSVAFMDDNIVSQ